MSGDYQKMTDSNEPEWPKLDLAAVNDKASGLTAAEVEERTAKYGKNLIPEHKESLLWMYFKQFTGTMPIMIEIAAVLAGVTKSWPDCIIITTLLLVNGTIGFFEEKAAQASVDALKENLESTCNVIREGHTSAVKVTEIVPGDVIFLRGGNVIPADCYFGDGDECSIDQASLTGESVPVAVPRDHDDAHTGKTEAWDKKPSDGKLLYSGAILKQGECYVVVHKTGIYTLMGEAAMSIQDSGGKQEGLFEGKIIQAARVLILITLVVVVVLGVKGIAAGTDPSEMLIKSLSLVIASVPVALPMVMKVTLSIGSKEMCDEGGIVTHTTALEEIASMRVLCSDKTGTLTLGRMTINYDNMKGYNGYTGEQALELASLASNGSNLDDPIDSAVFKALTKYYNIADDADAKKQKAAKQLKTKFSQDKYVGFNPTVKRTVYYGKDSKTGEKLQVAKGIVSRILQTNPTDGGVQWEVADLENMKKTVEKDDKEMATKGFKTIGVAVAKNDGPMKFIALLPIADPPRSDTADTIWKIRDKGIEVKMITGDHLNIAQEIGRQIELGTNIMPNTELHTSGRARDEHVITADGFAQVLPQDKTEVVATLQSKGMVVGMTGDGVNDAPALARAQIGIAVEGATEAAKSAADIVLTREGLSAIDTAVSISRRIFKRLKSYVIYRICITVQVVFFLVAINFISNRSFPALFIILLALVHDMQIVTIAYDKQIAGPKPETPTVMGLLLVSYTMGLTMCLQTVLMYYFGMQWLHLGPMFGDGKNDISMCEDKTNENETICLNQAYRDACMFLQISNSSAILIFSARSVKWFFSTMPAMEIVFSAAIGQVAIIAVMLIAPPALKHYIAPVPAMKVLIIIGYDLAWLFALDIVKQIMMYLWDSYEEAHKEPDHFTRQERKSANSMEKNVPGRKASYKGPKRNSFKK
jgi:H+-transporting ATPase